MGASLAADFPVEMVSQPLRGVRSAKLAVQGLPCIAWYGRLVHGNPLPLGMGSGQCEDILPCVPLDKVILVRAGKYSGVIDLR